MEWLRDGVRDATDDDDDDDRGVKLLCNAAGVVSQRSASSGNSGVTLALFGESTAIVTAASKAIADWLNSQRTSSGALSSRDPSGYFSREYSRAA